MYRLLFIILTLLASLGSQAQQLKAVHSHLTTADGLCSNTITALNQDGYGYIWIGTWNGISRYDGYKFFNYKTGNGSHVKNLHNHIRDLFIDQSQNVWMRMYDRRIFVLDRTSDKIINPLEGLEDADNIFSSNPLLITAAGHVIASTESNKLFVFRLSNKGMEERVIIPTDGLSVTCMAEDFQNDVWLGTTTGIRLLSKSNKKIEDKGLLAGKHITYLYSNGFNMLASTSEGSIYLIAANKEPQLVRQPLGKSIYSLFVDSKGLIWFCDDRMGASYLNPETGKEKFFHQEVPMPELDERGGRFTEVDSTVWVKMNHGGYGYYNRQADQVEYFHNDPINPWNLSNTVQTALELREGIVWESTKRRGLEKLEILKNNIVRVRPIANATLPIDNEIRGIFYDAQRHLLMLGNKNSSLMLNYDNGQRTIITHDKNGKPLGRIYGISKDSKGNYWICSKDNGVFRMSPNGSSWILENYCHEEGNNQSLSHNGAYMALEDPNGNMWIATYGGGVNVITKDANGKTVILNPDNGIEGYPKNSHRRVRAIEAFGKGQFWAGTTDGVLILTYKNGKVSAEKLKMKEEGNKMLMSNDIVSLKRDKDGTLWVGTNGGGLARTIGKEGDTWIFENFGAEEGLPSEEIRGITFDQKGNPWFATDQFICSFDLSTKVFSSFSTLEGVDETALSEGSAITLSSGNILFGTLDGYYIVDMKKLMADSGTLLKLQITDFFLDDEIQSPRLNDNISYYVPNSRSVTIPNGRRTFTFRFASLNYRLQHRVHYQYMLEGYDKEWRNAGKERMAIYVDVPAGKYTFKVKAFLLESPDKYDIRTIEVIVPSNFHLSKTAFAFGGVLIALLLIGGFLMYRKKKK